MSHGRPGRCDVHQHLWPQSLLDELRRRHEAPYLRDWTLHTSSEAPYTVDAGAHDVGARAALDPHTRVLLSMSAPLGVEALEPDDAEPLLAAWHDGVLALPAVFGGWASVAEREPDTAALADLLDRGLVGLQVSAGMLATPAGVERAAPTLRVCEQAGRPVLVHPGPSQGGTGVQWWAAVVDYSAQLQAAWWSWHVAGRAFLPELRICFVAGAGLAPLQHERFTARGGGAFVADPATFVDTSSHGPKAVDALVGALGADALVLGSDRPYAQPVDDRLDVDLRRAVGVINPARLLHGGSA